MAAAWPDFAAAWTYFAHIFACCLGPCVALCGPACPCFAYFASCHGPCVAFRGPRVALLCLLCFLSRVAFRDRRVALLCSLSTLLPVLVLRGFPWPPRGLALPTLLPVMRGLPWPPRGLTLPPRGLTLLTFLIAVLAPAWPSVAPRVLASLTLLPVMALAWPSAAPAWPCFTYFASCRVALLCLLCFLSCVAFRDRRVALLCSLSTLLPVLAPAWPSMAAAWPCFA